MLELNSAPETLYQEVGTALETLREYRRPSDRLVLFVNLCGAEMTEPLAFEGSFLEMLGRHRCSMEIWN